MNGISGYMNRFSPKQLQDSSPPSSGNPGITLTTPSPLLTPPASVTPAERASGSTGSSSKVKHPAFDFTLTDQYGKEHTLSDYKGKVIFLNFWATWCPPCRGELPDIEELYQEYGKNEGDVIILGVANPVSDAYPNNADVTEDEVLSFLEDKGYTFPVLLDETGGVLSDYYISAFPTTFMIDKQGNIYGYVPGALTKDMMINIINETLKSTD
jgi:cytochrome c-type biogenesis protein